MTWPMPLVELTDGYIVMREPVDDDADALTAVAQDEQSQKYTKVPADYTHEMAVDYMRSRAADPGTVMWAIEFSEAPGRYAGNLEIRLVSEISRTVSLAFTTAPWARRKGLMTHSANLALQHAFDNGARRVEVATLASNTASRMLLQNLGFVLEGIVQKGREHKGSMVDVAVFSRGRDTEAGIDASAARAGE
ncbi:GNAT family N-acetyltransferase [Corynebacterium mendelii]|nr:GNAT family protein [Corynebacterium mendelii]